MRPRGLIPLATISAAVFFACAGTPSPPSPSVPAPGALRAAVDEANADPALGPKWEAAGRISLQGLVVERYRASGGPTLLLAIDDWAPAFVLDTWTPISSRAPYDPAPVLAAVSKRRRLIERRTGAIVRPRGAVHSGWLQLGALHPRGGGCTGELESALSRGLGRLEEARRAMERASPRRPQTASVRERLEAALRLRLFAGGGGDPFDLEGPRAELELSRTIIVAAGRLDRVELLRELRRALGASTALRFETPVEQPAAPEKTSPAPGASYVSIPTDRAYALVAWPATGAGPEETAAILGLAELLASSDAGALGAHTLESSVARTPRGPVLEVLLGLESAATATAAADRLQAELERLAERPPSSEVLGGARGRLRMRALEHLDELGTRATTLALAEGLGGGVEALASELEAIDRLTPDTIAVAARALHAQKRLEVLAIPVGKEETR